MRLTIFCFFWIRHISDTIFLMFLNCCKISTITKTQEKPKEVTDNEQWAEAFLQWGGVLAGRQLYCCLGDNRNFLQRWCRAIAKAVGIPRGTTSRPELIKIHQAEVRALGEGSMLTTWQKTVFATVGNVTELWKTYELNLINCHESFRWPCKRGQLFHHNENEVKLWILV